MNVQCVSSYSDLVPAVPLVPGAGEVVEADRLIRCVCVCVCVCVCACVPVSVVCACVCVCVCSVFSVFSVCCCCVRSSIVVKEGMMFLCVVFMFMFM